MRPSSERSLAALRGVVACTLLIAACGGDENAPAADAAAPGGAPPVSVAGADVPGGASAATSETRSASPAREGLGGRTRELVNPDPDTMVLAYYDLAGITPPYDAWVEKDSRVTMAPAIERKTQREVVRSELEAAVAAARGVGSLRLSMDANLSDYDPTYGEFTVRALAPSSVVSFDAFGQKLELRFANGLVAQTWRVPEADAQLIRDQIGYARRVALDVLVRITDVQPGVGGGTLTTNVVEYELRAEQSGATVGRVQVPQ